MEKVTDVARLQRQVTRLTLKSFQRYSFDHRVFVIEARGLTKVGIFPLAGYVVKYCFLGQALRSIIVIKNTGRSTHVIALNVRLTGVESTYNVK